MPYDLFLMIMLVISRSNFLFNHVLLQIQVVLHTLFNILAPTMSQHQQTISGEYSATLVPGKAVSQFKVTVTVNKEMFLVRIPDPHFTVSWLAKHVAGRYYVETGTKVSLRIRDSEGAKLLNEDLLLGFVLAIGDKLTTEVSVVPDVDEECCRCVIL